jgi:hypothetical protein
MAPREFCLLARSESDCGLRLRFRTHYVLIQVRHNGALKWKRNTAAQSVRGALWLVLTRGFKPRPFTLIGRVFLAQQALNSLRQHNRI